MIESYSLLKFLAVFGNLLMTWGFLTWLACAVFCANLAYAKKRNGFLWFLAGLAFSIIALIAIAGMPVKPSEDNA